jgi:hypothetical protein
VADRAGRKQSKPLQFAVIGACLVAMLFVGQLISAQQKKPPAVRPHQFWAVAVPLVRSSTRTLPLTRPAGRIELRTVDGRLVYPAYRAGSVTVVGDLPTQRRAQALLTQLPSAEQLGAQVICVGPVAWCSSPPV